MSANLIMIIDDVPVSDVRIALANEQARRHDCILELERKGHIHILNDCDPGVIRVRIEDEVFSCARDKFPTTDLVARLQLAIAAGRSERNVVTSAADAVDGHPTGIGIYQHWAQAVHRDFYERSLYGRSPREALEEFTATVTTKARGAVAVDAKALRKGLRP